MQFLTHYFTNIYNKILFSSKGLIFVCLFNFKAWILNISNRIEFVTSSKHYILKEKGNSSKTLLIFAHEYQAAQAYARGLESRATALGNTYFLDLINFKTNDLVIDCGANVGDLFFWFKYRNMDINYLAFEPSIEEFRCLSKNIFPHQAVNSALWFEEANIDFYLNSHEADSSVIKPKNYYDLVSVEAVPLERIITSEVKLLKLEAEGAEPEVIRGAGKKLELIEFISADLGFERGAKNESTFIEVTNYLLENNFVLIEFSDARRCALFRNKKYFRAISLN